MTKKQWMPTVHLKWLKHTFYGDMTLMQLYYCYEIDNEGLCGARLEEQWRAVEIEMEK